MLSPAGKSLGHGSEDAQVLFDHGFSPLEYRVVPVVKGVCTELREKCHRKNSSASI